MYATTRLALGLLVAVASAASAAEPSVLGVFPLCEASAAKRIACPAGAQTQCVLVGDNETDDGLFRLEVGADGLLGAQTLLALPDDHEVGDVEALAQDGPEYFVVGSYSRNKSCEPKKKRRRIESLVLGEDSKLQAGSTRISDPNDSEWKKKLTESCKDGLIALPPGAESEGKPAEFAAAVCDAITAGEQFAGTDCGHAFNIEGAVVIKDDAGRGRLWVGLRSPTARVGSGGGPADERAVLLRVADRPTLTFDGVAMLDLRPSSSSGSLAIRELDTADGWLYGIGGPQEDDPADPEADRFVLWRVPLSQVRNGATTSPAQFVSSLPRRSEGLVVDGAGSALVLVDGDHGPKTATDCATHSQQVQVPATLPPPAPTLAWQEPRLIAQTTPLRLEWTTIGNDLTVIPDALRATLDTPALPLVSAVSASVTVQAVVPSPAPVRFLTELHFFADKQSAARLLLLADLGGAVATREFPRETEALSEDLISVVSAPIMPSCTGDACAPTVSYTATITLIAERDAADVHASLGIETLNVHALLGEP